MSKQVMSKKNSQTVRFADIDVSKFSLGDIQETDVKSPQKFGWTRYNDSIHYFQTPPLVLRVGGIPKHNPQYHKKTDVEDRGYAKLPLDAEHSGGELMIKRIEELDAHFESLQETLFGEASKNYQYVPMLRYPSEDEEGVIKQTNSKYPPLPKLPYIRVKLDFDTNTKLLKTVLVLKEESGELTTPVVEHIDDIQQHFRLNSEYVTVLAFAKFWVAKNKKSSAKDAKKEWGITIKMRRLQVKVKPTYQKGERQDDFLDEEEESEMKQVVKQTKQSKQEVEETQYEEAEYAEEQEHNEEYVEEQEEDLEVPPPKQATKQVAESKKGKATGKSTSKSTGKKTSRVEV
jgi:hypothetical protein